ncbi:MAG: hypothetical protein GY778_03055, partial [bacterium]|nr:hypothetical protein [bacterium]
ELYIYEEGGQPVGDAVVYINAGGPWQTDPHDIELLFDPPGPGWTYIDATAAGLEFAVGDKFVIGVQGIGENLWFGGSSPSPGGPYAGGQLWFQGSVYQGGQYDMAFRTYVQSVAATPPSPVASGVYLAPPYPNPFSSVARVAYTIPSELAGVPLRLTVCDAGGRLVRTLLAAGQAAGSRVTEWNGTDDLGHAVPGGIYFFRLSGRGFSRTERILCLRR